MQEADLPHHFLQHDEVEEIVEYVDVGEGDVQYEEWSGQDEKHDVRIKGQEIISHYVEDETQYYEQDYEEIFEEEIEGDEALSTQYEDGPNYHESYIYQEPSASNSKKLTIEPCEFCGIVIKHPSKINAHRRTHTGEKPFQCHICGMRFTQRTPMVNHLRKHLGDMPYVCGFGCGKRFVNNARKNAHELRHQGMKRQGPPRPYLKPPRRKISLETSQIKNEPNRFDNGRIIEERSSMIDCYPPFGQIPMSAASSKRLDEVIEAVASGVSIPAQKQVNTRASVIAQCHICGLMVKYPSKIQAHMRTHTGEKPYECKECGARFAAASPLKMHMKRKHLEERKIPCSWDCGRMFVSIGARNEHERIVHEGIKRYECTVPGCRKMFTRRQYLMLHRMKEHQYAPVFDPNEILQAEVDNQDAGMMPGDGGEFIATFDEMEHFTEEMMEINESDGIVDNSEVAAEESYGIVDPSELRAEDSNMFSSYKVVGEPSEPSLENATNSIVNNDFHIKEENDLNKVVEETVKHVWMPGKNADQRRKISVRILKRTKPKGSEECQSNNNENRCTPVKVETS